jgi:glycosyltransferase involved in cell wall biosynthesis
MKRVLIIVENLPVPLDRRVWQEACALRDAGHEVTVICPKMRGYDQAEETLEDIRILRHWISGEGRGVIGLLAEYATALVGEFICALKAWRRGGFDVIHLCNPPDLLFLIALPFRWLAGVRVVYDVHDLWPEMFEAKFGRRGLLYHAVRLTQRLTLTVADVVLATNESVRANVMRRGNRAQEDVIVVRTAPRNLDTDARPDPSLRRGRRHLVGFVGVMGRVDGVHYLLEAARHLIKTRGREDVQFHLMGTGPEFDDLLRQRDTLGLQDHVAMTGRVSNGELFTALSTMDVGVACDPINEYNDCCTMNKTLEYMAFGKAQVMFETREGRRSAGDAAVYVSENSAEKLGDAILALLDDGPCRIRLGQIGRERLEKELNWNLSVKSLLAAYERLEPSGRHAPATPGTISAQVMSTQTL